MVQLMKSLDRMSVQEPVDRTDKPPVKLEIEDSLEDEHGPAIKRSKTTSQCFQKVFLVFVLLFFCFFFFFRISDWLP